MTNIQKRALVAMSGGVDSAVAAIIMQEAGYDMSKLPFRVPRNDINEFAAYCSIYHEQLEIAAYLESQIIVMNYNMLVGELLKHLRSAVKNQINLTFQIGLY